MWSGFHLFLSIVYPSHVLSLCSPLIEYITVALRSLVHWLNMNPDEVLSFRNQFIMTPYCLVYLQLLCLPLSNSPCFVVSFAAVTLHVFWKIWRFFFRLGCKLSFYCHSILDFFCFLSFTLCFGVLLCLVIVHKYIV